MRDILTVEFTDPGGRKNEGATFLFSTPRPPKGLKVDILAIFGPLVFFLEFFWTVRPEIFLQDIAMIYARNWGTIPIFYFQ